MRPFLLAAVLLLLVPRVALGQVELIVRLDGAAEPALAQMMRRQAAQGGAVQLNRAGADSSAFQRLFGGVGQVEAVLGAAPPTASAQRPQEVYTLNVPDSSALEDALARWAQHPGVRYAQRNHVYTLSAVQTAPPARPDDPLLDSLGHLPLIRAFEAWEQTTGRADVRIGFIDTGLLFEHPDLAGQAWVNPGEDANGNGRRDAADFNGIDDDGNGFVDDISGYDFVDRFSAFQGGDYQERDPDPSVDPATGGFSFHGTAVAGILAAAQGNGVGISGVAPGARLVPLRAFAGDGGGADDDIAAAIVYAADLGVEVLNLSFGDLFYSPLMEEAIQYAADQGVVIVGSAGNAPYNEPHYPSDYPDVISVGGLSADGERPAGFNRGPQVALSAPAVGIYTTGVPDSDDADPDRDAFYTRVSGTSFAAPMVAGAAALLRSADASLAAASVRNAFAATATDVAGPGLDEDTGAGRLNVAAALLRAYPARTEITFPEVDDGFAEGAVPIVGSAVDPAFASFRVEYAVGDRELEGAWQSIAGPFEAQAYRDTLAVWDVAELPDTTYTLRVAVALRTGGTVEARRRVYVDRSPPDVEVRLLEAGLVGPYYGVFADVRSADLTRAVMRIRRGGDTTEVVSGLRAYRHGLVWPDEAGRGGPVQVELTATNAAGLTTTVEETVAVPANRMNAALFTETATDVPAGYLLPRATDFDGDGLLEMSFNQFEENNVFGDTLATVEWAGDGFRAVQRLPLVAESRFQAPFSGEIITNRSGLIPRDVGDTNGNGLQEILSSITNVAVLTEQPQPGAYPQTEIFRDTTGQSFALTPEARAAGAVNAALLDDLDQDGRTEIISHNNQRQWQLLERTEAGGFEPVVTLENPTGAANPDSAAASLGNEAGSIEALTGDFDGDGRRDLLTGDVDGDWILYESAGDDAARVAWTFETDAYYAGRRFAKGDFDGDGTDEFVTYAENWPDTKRPANAAVPNNERTPAFGFYHFWDQAGDDEYALQLRLPVLGALQEDGALAAADFDGDGRDEVALLSPPRLYVLSFEGGAWRADYVRAASGAPADTSMGPDALRSPALLAADFDANGLPELIAASVDGRFHRFAYQRSAAGRPPPRWVEARPLGAERVRLAWRAPGADSVTVLRGPPGGALDRIAGTPDSSIVDQTVGAAEYRLQAWTGGAGSALSEARHIEPHAAARLLATAYPDTATVRLTFSEALAPATRAAQFRLDDGPDPEEVLLTEGGRALLLRFARPMSGRADTLRWTDLQDASGLAVPSQAVPLRFPEARVGRFIIASWDVLGPRTVDITFNQPLDAVAATDAGNYALQPAGRVARAAVDEGDPRTVRVEIEDGRVGAVGRGVFLTVRQMQSAGGAALAAEGRTIQLNEAAADLSDVFVYPNPFRAERHRAMTVAGLPPEATVRIVSVQGTLVKVIEETDGDGGAAWDLTDERNRRVPPGVYLIRVEAPGEQPVLKKAAVIR